MRKMHKYILELFINIHNDLVGVSVFSARLTTKETVSGFKVVNKTKEGSSLVSLCPVHIYLFLGRIVFFFEDISDHF